MEYSQRCSWYCRCTALVSCKFLHLLFVICTFRTEVIIPRRTKWKVSSGVSCVLALFPWTTNHIPESCCHHLNTSQTAKILTVFACGEHLRAIYMQMSEIALDISFDFHYFIFFFTLRWASHRENVPRVITVDNNNANDNLSTWKATRTQATWYARVRSAQLNSRYEHNI